MRYFCLLLFAVLLAGCKSSDEAVLLRLKYKPGDQQIYVVEEKLNGLMVNIDNWTKMLFTVDSVQNGGKGYALYGQVKNLNFESKIGDKTQHYDSDDIVSQMSADERQLHDQLKEFLYQNYEVGLSDRGEVTKPFNVGGRPVSPPIDPGLIQLTFPEQKVKVGYTWIDKRQNPLLKTTNTFTYTIKNIKADRVIIHARGKIKGFKTLVNDFEVAGDYDINRADGHLISGYFSGSVQGNKILISVTTSTDPKIIAY